MKMSSLLFSLVLATTSVFSAPLLVLHLKSGLKTETDVSQIQRLSFSSTAITVHPKTGNAAATLLTDLNKITFATPVSLHSPHSGISIRLTQMTEVEATLSDLQGRKVVHLGRLSLPAGAHQLSLEGFMSNLQLKNGLYFFSVAVLGEKPQTQLISWMQ